MNKNKLGEISDGLKRSITEQSKLAHEIVDLLKQLVQPRVLNADTAFEPRENQISEVEKRAFNVEEDENE